MTDKTAVLLDGNNIYRTCNFLEIAIDYRKLRDWLEKEFDNVIDIAWYTGAPGKEEGENHIHKVIDWMGYNGYTVITKVAKSVPASADENEERKRWRSNIDIEMTIDALRMAREGGVNHFILGSGDGDFVPLVEELRRLGCVVTVLSSIKGPKRSCADSLRQAARYFVDLADIGDQIRNERNFNS